MARKKVEWKCKKCGCRLNVVEVEIIKGVKAVALHEKLKCMMCAALHWVKAFTTGTIRSYIIE